MRGGCLTRVPKSPVFTGTTAVVWLFRLPALALNIPPRCALIRLSMTIVNLDGIEILGVGADRRVRPHGTTPL